MWSRRKAPRPPWLRLRRRLLRLWLLRRMIVAALLLRLWAEKSRMLLRLLIVAALLLRLWAEKSRTLLRLMIVAALLLRRLAIKSRTRLLLIIARRSSLWADKCKTLLLLLRLLRLWLIVAAWLLLLWLRRRLRLYENRVLGMRRLWPVKGRILLLLQGRLTIAGRTRLLLRPLLLLWGRPRMVGSSRPLLLLWGRPRMGMRSWRMLLCTRSWRKRLPPLFDRLWKRSSRPLSRSARPLYTRRRRGRMPPWPRSSRMLLWRSSRRRRLWLPFLFLRHRGYQARICRHIYVGFREAGGWDL